MERSVFFCSLLVVLMVSCSGKNSSEYKALQAQKDSIELANAKISSDMDEVLGLLNEVEDNFRSIKEAENYLAVQAVSSGDMNPTTKERIQNDMQLVAETLKKNKEHIAELEKRLKKSNLQSLQLRSTLENLRNELNEKTMALVNLQNELATRDQKIEELSESVSALSSDVQSLKSETNAQRETIRQQETALNTVYYCFGTSKELKEQKILVGKELNANFNREFFIRVKDAKKLIEIPLFAKKAKLLTKHPDGSYEFIKDVSGNVTCKITDVNNFWSLSKYLVIQVNV